MRPLMTRDGWPRVVERQFEHSGRIRLRLPPVIELLLKHLSSEPFPLPHRIVRILNRQLR